MKRLPLLLLLIGIIVGLTAQLPASALAAPMRATAATGIAQNSVASMPDCKSGTPKKASPAPCKCGMAGCIAMMTSGVAMLRPEGLAFADASVASKLARPTAPSASLRGRSTAPEPEPPSA